MAKKKPTRSANEPKEMSNHQEENRDSEPQSKSAVDGSVEKFQLETLKSLNERLLKETHEKRVEVGALVQAKEGLELDLKKNVDEKKQVMDELSEACDEVCGLGLEKNVVCVYVRSQMEEMGGGIFGLVESERVKDVEIGRLKADINGLVLKVEEEREKWRKVCCERDEIKVDFDGLFEETGDLKRKVVEMENNERRALEEIENFKVKCKKLSGEKIESEILNGTLLKEKELVTRLLDESGRVIEDLERKVDLQMKEKVEIEKEKNVLEMEIEDLKVKCKKLSGEKMESENLNETLLKEKELVKRLLDESGRVIEDLERKVDVKMKEKVEVEKEKNVLEMEIEKLEKEVAQLNESSLCLKQEKEENGKVISALVKKIEEAVEKENGMLREVSGLVKELQKKEKDMEMLTQQRDSLDVNLNQVRQEAENLQCKIEIITCDKAEMEEAKMEAENIIEDLQRESSKLKEAIASLTGLSDAEKARNEELLSQIDCLQEALNEVSLERDNAINSCAVEKMSAGKLSLLLEDKERRIDEAMNELDKAKIAQVDSLNVAKEMERRIEILVGERDGMEKSLLEAQSRIDEQKGRVKSAVANSEKALALLKETCMAVCDGYEKGEGKASSEHKFVEEMQPFVEHLDAIKTSFTNKGKMVEEMKQCLETARAEERKKKSFFTLVTAATTILAAMSVAYVSKGR